MQIPKKLSNTDTQIRPLGHAEALQCRKFLSKSLYIIYGIYKLMIGTHGASDLANLEYTNQIHQFRASTQGLKRLIYLTKSINGKLAVRSDDYKVAKRARLSISFGKIDDRGYL